MAVSFATRLLRTRGRELRRPGGGEFDFDVKLTISPQLLDRLSTLPDKLQKKGALRASRKAMRIALNAARAAARDLDDQNTLERIWKNVVIQNSTRQGRREGGIVMRLGVLGGAKQYAKTHENVRKGRIGKTYKTLGDKGNPGGDTWYWRFLELGTRRTAVREFLQPALKENSVLVEGLLAEYLWREIELLTPKT